MNTTSRNPDSVSIENMPLEVRLEDRLLDPAADLGARLGEGTHVLHVELRQALVNALLELVVREEVVEGLRGGREAARHAHVARRELADELAEGSVLAAD